MKNELGTHEFPSSSVGATPYWGKGQQVKKNIYIYTLKVSLFFVKFSLFVIYGNL